MRIKDIGFSAKQNTVAVVELGVALPSALGYVGVFHSFCVVAIGFFKNDKEIRDFIIEKLKNVPVFDYDVGQVLKKEKEIFYWS